MSSVNLVRAGVGRTQCGPCLLVKKISLQLFSKISQTSNYSTATQPTICSQSFIRTRARPRLQQRIVGTRLGHSQTSETNPLRRTALYDLHVESKAKMVPFGGYLMPVQYADLTVSESHNWTREKASLFDVGHMVQHHLKGPGAIHLLEKITPSSIAALQPGQSTLSCFLHPASGGMVDDIVISRPEYVAESNVFHIVSNAACREKDNAYITEQIARSEKSHGAISWEILSNQGLIALQGPSSPELLQDILRPKALGPGNRLNIDLKKLYFGQNKAAAVTGLPDGSQPEILISRGGYTGEDGFELSIPAAHTAAIAKHLLKTASPARLRLAGLAARDSLRLEAGMCLYGQDLDDSTTPVEAGLGWIVHADRRANGGFYGDGVILDQLRALKDGTGPSRRRVGLVIEGAPARTGAQILAYDATGDHASEPPRLSEKARDVVGMVTSGCPSPTLGQNIAMGYVQMGFHRANTELRVLVRGKERKAVVTKMPFVRSRYWKQPSGMAPG